MCSSDLRTPDNVPTAYVTDRGGRVSHPRAFVSGAGGLSRPRALVSWCGNKVKDGEIRKRLGGSAASRTPLEFRDVLIAIARWARVEERAA